MRTLLLLLSCLIFVGAATATAADPLAGTQWTLVDLPGRNLAQVPRQKHPTMRFDGARFRGRGVCNALTATYTMPEPGLIRFSRVGGNMMPCREGQQLEAFFIQQIEGVVRYAVEGDTLVLTTRTGRNLRFARQAEAAD